MDEMTNGAVTVSNEGGAHLMPRKKSTAPLIVLGAVVALTVIGYGVLCVLAYTSTTFFPGSAIAGADIAGLTADAAAQTAGKAVLGREYILILDGEEQTFTARDLGVYQDGDITAAVRAAYDDQHSGGILSGGWTYLQGLLGKNTVTHVLPYSKTAVEQAAAQLKQDFDRAPVDASYALSETGVTVTVGRDGRSLNEAALAQMLEAAVSFPGESGSVTLNAEPIPARTLTAQAIHDDIAGEMKNAGYDASTDTITPEQLGADFDVSAAQKLLDNTQPGTSVTIPARIEFPEVTAEELKEVLFRDVLGECKTHVTGTNARKTNVRLAAEKINGHIMNSGDVFSYNEVVGQRTAAAGFKPAPAYVRGETVDEIGGGICQVSSTLYYACLKGNLEITERYAHRYVPAYIDWGMDATVSWGGPDYKFTNDTSYPIRIETVYANDYVTVRILGTNADGSYARMTNDVLSRTDWTTEYVEDASIPSGTEKVKTTPYTGYLVKSYRHVYDKDGKLISSAYEATSSYKVRNKVVLRAPGELVGVQAPVTPPTTSPQTPDGAAETPDAPQTPSETPENGAPAEETPAAAEGGGEQTAGTDAPAATEASAETGTAEAA